MMIEHYDQRFSAPTIQQCADLLPNFPPALVRSIREQFTGTETQDFYAGLVVGMTVGHLMMCKEMSKDVLLVGISVASEHLLRTMETPPDA